MAISETTKDEPENGTDTASHPENSIASQGKAIDKSIENMKDTISLYLDTDDEEKKHSLTLKELLKTSEK